MKNISFFFYLKIFSFWRLNDACFRNGKRSYLFVRLYFGIYLLRTMSLRNNSALITTVIVIAKIMANSVDPDQTPRSVASDQGQQCLPRFM